MSNNRFGFTLSEVLLVLSVIGVVAALTIPTLIQKVSNDQYKQAWKKALSVASQSYTMALVNNGGTGFGTYSCWAGTGNPMQKWSAFKANLNIIKDCNGNAFGNCWASNGVGPDSNVSGGCGGFTLSSQNANKSFITADGMSWMLYSGGPCELVAVDVNGAKSPNQWGADTFSFVLGDASIERMGFCINDNNSTNYLYQ